MVNFVSFLCYLWYCFKTRFLFDLINYWILRFKYICVDKLFHELVFHSNWWSRWCWMGVSLTCFDPRVVRHFPLLSTCCGLQVGFRLVYNICRATRTNGTVWFEFVTEEMAAESENVTLDDSISAAKMVIDTWVSFISEWI